MSDKLSGVLKTSCACLVKLLIVVALWEVEYDDSSSNLSVCVGFLSTVVRSSSVVSAYKTFEKRKLAVFFDLSGNLNIDVLFVKVFVKSVNFVFVYGAR